jgi:hypothetical protein
MRKIGQNKQGFVQMGRTPIRNVSHTDRNTQTHTNCVQNGCCWRFPNPVDNYTFGTCPSGGEMSGRYHPPIPTFSSISITHPNSLFYMIFNIMDEVIIHHETIHDSHTKKLD